MAFATGASAANAAPAQPMSPITVQSANEAVQTGIEMGIRFKSGGTHKAGEAIKKMLAPYPGLPKATIAILEAVDGREKRTSNSEGSAAVSSADGDCVIALVVDPGGKSTVASSFQRTMGVDTSENLSARLLAYETLHELGHCANNSQKIGFSHPAMSSQENINLHDALNGTRLGDIWQESYADAYAALHMLEGARSDPAKFAKALADVELIKSWREMGRDKSASLGADGELRIDAKDPHATEKTLQELTEHTSKWLDSAVPLEQRAAQLASIGTVRIAKAATDEALLAKDAFNLGARVDFALDDIAKEAGKIARLAEKIDDPEYKKNIVQTHARQVAAAQARSGPLNQIAATQIEPVFAAAIAVAAKETKQSSTGPAMEDAAYLNAIKHEAAARGAYVQAQKALPTQASSITELLTNSWDKALNAEKESPSFVKEAKDPALEKAKAFEAKGELSIDPSFYQGPSKLSDWRAKRAAQSPAQEPKPVAGRFSPS